MNNKLVHHKSYGGLLKIIREKLNRDNAELVAITLDVTGQALRNYRSGERRPDILTLLRLALYYDIDFTFSCDGQGDITTTPEEIKQAVCNKLYFLYYESSTYYSLRGLAAVSGVSYNTCKAILDARNNDNLTLTLDTCLTICNNLSIPYRLTPDSLRE